MDSSKLKAMLASYGRSFLAAATAVWASGNQDLKSVLIAALASTLPVAIRALNPKDPAFGIVSKIVQDQLENLAKKAPAKKSAKA